MPCLENFINDENTQIKATIISGNRGLMPITPIKLRLRIMCAKINKMGNIATLDDKTEDIFVQSPRPCHISLLAKSLIEFGAP